ncbi:NAD(P)-binding protein [Exidia glandulosa HHB12029]|uniref:NAD(P)-binding protein n=1 Tax=Exidia glandulosa HHB12029 TaxID=1314781 RepID=A0A165EKF8_EXIGL|nr:NAD(P)-binding protein [Exidia glandulosa HHB12029]
MAKVAQSTVVVITGCSVGGLGAALAECFATKGCTVFATARNISKMDGLSAGIQKVELDVTNAASVSSAVNTVVQQAGKIDILVNNAGGHRVGALMDVPLEDAESVFQTNVLGVMRVTQAVVHHMAKRRAGLIINVGSLSGFLTTPWYGVYSASKAALHSYSETLDMELRHVNIKVMLLAIGMVRSNISANTAAKHGAPPPDSLYDQYRANIDARLGQGAVVMSAEDFALKTVEAALSANPPRYMSFGGQAGFANIMTWLPREWRLSLLWKWYTDKKPMV